MNTRVETWTEYTKRADAIAAAKAADELDFMWSLSRLRESDMFSYRLVIWVTGEKVHDG